MIEVTVQSGATLSRSVSGYIRAVKQLTGHEFSVPLRDEWGTCGYHTGEFAVSLESGINIEIYGANPNAYMAGGVPRPFISARLEFVDYVNLIAGHTDPDDCDLYLPDAHDHEAGLDWKLSGGVFGVGLTEVQEEAVAAQGYNSWYAESWGNIQVPHPGWGTSSPPDPPENVLYDVSVPYEVKIQGQFDLVANYSYEMIYPSGEVYGGNPHDYNPWGMSSRILEFFYRPAGDITVTITVDGSVRFTQTYDATDFGGEEDFNEIFKNGFGMVGIEPSTAKTWAGTDDTWPPVVEEGDQYIDCGEMLEAAIGGMPDVGTGPIPAQEKTIKGDLWGGDPPEIIGSYDRGIASFASGVYKLSSRSCGVSDQFRAWNLSSDTVYRAFVTNWDGAARAGVDISIAEYSGAWEWPQNLPKDLNTAMPPTNASGASTKTIRHPGDVRGFNAAWDSPNQYYELAAASNGQGARKHEASEYPTSVTPSLGVTNLDDLREPRYPEHEELEIGHYHDGRCELFPDLDALRFDAAMTISAPTSSVIAFFDDHTEWSVVSGSANLSNVGGALVVEVLTDCKITKARTDEPFDGCRYADLNYSVAPSNTNPLTISLEDERYWTVTPTANEIDWATPLGVTAQATNQVDDWGWGATGLDDLSIAGLKAGYTYTFSNITLKRKGPIKVTVFGGGFVGDARGCDRKSDLYTMHAGWTRKAIVWIDGMPAAVIRDTYHEQTDPNTWEHRSACANDSGVLQPTNGFVTVSAAEADLETAFLVPGHLHRRWVGGSRSAGANPRHADTVALQCGQPDAGHLQAVSRRHCRGAGRHRRRRDVGQERQRLLQHLVVGTVDEARHLHHGWLRMDRLGVAQTIAGRGPGRLPGLLQGAGAQVRRQRCLRGHSGAEPKPVGCAADRRFPDRRRRQGNYRPGAGRSHLHGLHQRR